MKLLILTSLLILSVHAAHAQQAVSDRNIQQCFKHSIKTPAAFDRCVAEEFNRVRDEKAYREARLRVGKDPDAGCAKRGAYRECFEEILADMRTTADRLHELGDPGPSYFPPHFHLYYPRLYPRIYPRTYYPIYPRVYVPRFYIPFRRY